MKKWLGLVALLIAIVGYFFSGKKEDVPIELKVKQTVDDINNSVKSDAEIHDHGDKKRVKKENSVGATPPQQPAKIPSFKPKTKAEESLVKVAETFKEVFDAKSSANEFSDKLKKLGLRTLISVNSNQYTGGMKIVRTNNNLEGTRYIHGQFVTDENGNEFPQHLSVEHPKGPNALQKTADFYVNVLGIETKPIMSTGDFISYKLTPNYTIWFKRMANDDLQNDPFNAYTKNDVGTIRVGVELEIHGDEHDSHVYPDGN